MSQSDYTLETSGVTGNSFRDDLTDAIKASASINSGPTEPPAILPNMLWADTSSSSSNPALKARLNGNWRTIIPGMGSPVLQQVVDGVTLFPDLTLPYGGLTTPADAAAAAAAAELTRTRRHRFEGNYVFPGDSGTYAIARTTWTHFLGFNATIDPESLWSGHQYTVPTTGYYDIQLCLRLVGIDNHTIGHTAINVAGETLAHGRVFEKGCGVNVLNFSQMHRRYMTAGQKIHLYIYADAISGTRVNYANLQVVYSDIN